MRKCLPKTFLSAYSIALSFVFVNQKVGKSFRKKSNAKGVFGILFTPLPKQGGNALGYDFRHRVHKVEPRTVKK